MSESNHLENIQKIIEDLAANNSFSAKAMKQFTEMRDELESLESTNNYLRRGKKELEDDLKRIEKSRDELVNENMDLKSELAHYHTRESELQDRESQAEVLSMTVAYERMRVDDHKNMVGLIFRNTEIRKRVFGQELVAMPGTPDETDQYGNRKWGTGQPPEVIGVPIAKDETETEG
jgi:predicted nuclease with TOPRIM domain